MNEFDRITHDPSVMVGKACIRGMRVTVEMIVGQLGTGTTVDELLEAYPYLERFRLTRRSWPMRSCMGTRSARRTSTSA